MSILINQTPLAAQLKPHISQTGQRCNLLIVKGTWSLQTNCLHQASSLTKLLEQPIYLKFEDMDLSQIQKNTLKNRQSEDVQWVCSDMTPPKPLFDMLVCGYAYAPNSTPKTQFTAGIGFDNKWIGLRIFAPRYWEKTLLKGGGAAPGVMLGAVEKVPLHPIFAYGGKARSNEQLFNPLGMGSLGEDAPTRKIAMPWLESPDDPVKISFGNPKPAAFGPWPENAHHRQIHMGTYDEDWLRHMHPYAPKDQNPQFFNVAEPRLQWRRSPFPGERITLSNLSQKGNDQIIWPKLQPMIHQSPTQVQAMHADTCTLDTEAQCYAITWRAILPPSKRVDLRVAIKY